MIEKMTDTELKAYAYDALVKIQSLQNDIKIIEQELVARAKQLAEQQKAEVNEG